MPLSPATWIEALRVIPRVTKEEWNDLDLLARWLIATRSAVLVMTLHSALIAGLLAFRAEAFDFGIWMLVTLGLLFAHATNNLVNDLTDHVRGVDEENYFRAQYGPQPLEHGLLTKAQMSIYILCTGMAAVAAGMALVYIRGEATIWLMAAGVFFVLFYTWPLKLLGLGEFAVTAVWGPLMIAGGAYVIAGFEVPNAIWISLPPALAATTVLFGKHTDKLEDDRAKKIRTMPVLLGEKYARYTTILLIVACYAITLGLVVSDSLGWPMLVIIAGFPFAKQAVQALAQPRPSTPPPELPKDIWPLWYAAFTFRHTRVFGTVFFLGLTIDVLLHRIGAF